MHYSKLPSRVDTSYSEGFRYMEEDGSGLMTKLYEEEYCAFWESVDDYYNSSDDDEEEKDEAVTPIEFGESELTYSVVNGDCRSKFNCCEGQPVKCKTSDFYSIIGNSIIGNDIGKLVSAQQHQEVIERWTDLIDALQYNVKKMNQLASTLAAAVPKSLLK